jgi:hypothetical protein
VIRRGEKGREREGKSHKPQATSRKSKIKVKEGDVD